MKLKNKIKYINGLLVLLVLSVSSCLDPIELDIPKGFEETLVFEARLVQGNPSTFEFYSSRLFDFTPESLGRVNVRTVTLEDEMGNKLDVPSFGTGVHIASIPANGGPISVEVGKSYKVSVSTFDGRVFESSLEPLLAVPAIDSVYFEKTVRNSVFADGVGTSVDTVVRFFVNTSVSLPNSTERVSLKWDVRRNFQVTDSPIRFGVPQKTCYLAEETDVTNVKVYGAEEFTFDDITDRQIYDQRVDFHLAEGYYFELVQSSLSPDAFKYFDQIAQVLERDGNMFETPAGKLITNFSNVNDPEDETFGYFYAAQADTFRVYVSPDLFTSTINRCPSEGLVNPDGTCGDQLCCDCLSDPRSTTIRPAFWTE